MSEPSQIVVPLAEGFEEIEAVAVIDVLRRAELDVRVLGVAGDAPVTGSHGIRVAVDGALADVDAAEVRAVVLPGGMPGSATLAADERVLGLLRAVHAAGRDVAAICAAPIALEAAGLLGDGPVTSHPSVWGKLGRAAVDEASRVVEHGRVTTSQGPGTALEFALALVARFTDRATADALAKGMRVR